MPGSEFPQAYPSIDPEIPLLCTYQIEMKKYQWKHFKNIHNNFKHNSPKVESTQMFISIGTDI